MACVIDTYTPQCSTLRRDTAMTMEDEDEGDEQMKRCFMTLCLERTNERAWSLYLHVHVLCTAVQCPAANGLAGWIPQVGFLRAIKHAAHHNLNPACLSGLSLSAQYTTVWRLSLKHPNAQSQQQAAVGTSRSLAPPKGQLSRGLPKSPGGLGAWRGVCGPNRTKQGLARLARLPGY